MVLYFLLRYDSSTNACIMAPNYEFDVSINILASTTLIISAPGLGGSISSKLSSSSYSSLFKSIGTLLLEFVEF